MNNYTEILKEFSNHSAKAEELFKILNQELAMPNIPTPTMGGEVFWNTLVEYNGWKLQQNMFFRHARILDKNNIRIAWGTINGMTKVLDRMVEYLHRYDEPTQICSNPMEAMEQLIKLRELLNIGAITEQEFQEKKEKLLPML